LVTDASGCTSTYNFSLTDPLPLQLNVLSVSDVQCFGMNNGSVSSSGSGGTQPYSFSFGSQTSGNGSFSALAPGIYTLLLTDANGCTQQQNVTINEPPLLSLNVVQVTDPACYGMSNGSISLSASGGVPGYSFQVGSASNAAGLFLNLSAGNYSVIVSDNQSCTSSLTITLNQPPELLIQTISASDPLCSGDANGYIQIAVSGGTVMAGYQYSWNTSPVQTSQNINNLPAGTYSVTITDDVGCTVQGSWVLNDPSFALNPFPDQQICAGDSLILMAGYLGGANPISVQWTDLNTGQSYNTELLQLLPVNSTDFQITATDANGCVAIPLGFQLTILPSAIPSFTVSETQGCAPLCVTFNGSASLPGAQLSWLTGDGSAYSGQTNLIHCYQSPGLFDLTLAAITAEGCTTKVNADDFIAVGANPVADFSFSPSSIFLDEGSVFISDINPQSGFELSWIAPFEIEWKENKGLITPSDSGNYCVTLAASNDFGCADTVRKCFRAELPYRLFIPSAFTPNSDGRNEIFLPEGGPFKEIEMSLYDRWGRTIYREAGRSLHGWTGEGFPQGVYVYLISAKDSEGVAHEYKGTVTLYR
jgi:gliding motility-associated-like protein